MEKDGEDKEDDHENDWSWGFMDTKETDEADDCQVDTCCGLLQRTRVYQAFGVDIGVVNEEEVVTIGEIDQIQTDCRETKDKRSDDRVSDCWESVSVPSLMLAKSTLTNHSQVGIDRKDGTPSQSGKSRKSLVHLSWCGIQEFPKNLEKDQSDNLQQRSRTECQALKDEVRNVEIGRLGKVVRQ